VPNFFLSSAAGDDDPYVQEFFEDLRRRVSLLSSDHGADQSFLGTVGNRPDSWPSGMLLGLATCDVFVALVSPRYLLNENCGRQWELFAQRLAQAGQRPGEPSSAMIAVAWTPEVETPAFVGDVMVPRDDEAGAGLRQFVRLRRMRQSYEGIVDELARRIVAVGERSPAPTGESVRDFTAVPNAFALSTATTKVHFVVAAATREEMHEVRKSLAYYGPKAIDWAPYMPPESLANRARTLAADQALQAEVTALDDVIERIERARAANEIVVVLVDWWITQLESYQEILAEIDHRELGSTAVLVPASRSDPETMENRDELRFGLRNALRRMVDHPDAILRTDIGTQDAFDADLASVIEEARNRLFRFGPTPPPHPQDSHPERPLLRGP
jgi:FxsC-like protein